MGIKYIQGDIIKALINIDIDILAHGVNCRGAFGSGMAGAIAMRLPKVREEYMLKHRSDGWELGQTQLINIYEEGEDYQYIYKVMNCATQNYYGRNPKSQSNNMYCNYEAIHMCMQEYYNYCKKHNLKPGIPYIGCGLAGGDWNEVSKIIEEVFSDITICVYRL